MHDTEQRVPRRGFVLANMTNREVQNQKRKVLDLIWGPNPPPGPPGGWVPEGSLRENAHLCFSSFAVFADFQLKLAPNRA